MEALEKALQRLVEEAQGVAVDNGFCPFCGVMRHVTQHGDCQCHDESCAIMQAKIALREVRNARSS